MVSKRTFFSVLLTHEAFRVLQLQEVRTPQFSSQWPNSGGPGSLCSSSSLDSPVNRTPCD